MTNRNEPLKATAASTLARLLRYNPGLLRFLLDKYGIRHLVAGALHMPSVSLVIDDVRLSAERSHRGCERQCRLFAAAALAYQFQMLHSGWQPFVAPRAIVYDVSSTFLHEGFEES